MEVKKVLSFDVDGIDSLANLINKGLKGYAFSSVTPNLMSTLWCFLCDGTVVRIHSVMNDLGGWDEIGTLAFELVIKDSKLPEMIALPPTWSDIVSVEKLVLDEVEFSAESGLVIRVRNGEELLVVCGANVYTIQLAAPFFSGEFRSEYDITKYKRIFLSTPESVF